MREGVYTALAIQKGGFRRHPGHHRHPSRAQREYPFGELRRQDGVIMARTGDHERHWDNADEKVSTLLNVQVPLFNGNYRWGSFEICFETMHTNILQRI